MPIISQDNDDFGGYDFDSDNVYLVVKQNVILSGKSDSLYSSYSGDSINNLGFLNSEVAGIALFNNHDIVIFNGSSGIISGNLNAGIYSVLTENLKIYNQGDIISSNGYALHLTGVEQYLSNSGTIESEDGILVDQDIIIENTGTIGSGIYGITINNSSDIFNSGTISCDINGENADSGIRIKNSGTINGNIYSGFGSGNISNSGTINGYVYLATDPRDGFYVLINYGTINGSVFGSNSISQEDILNEGIVLGDIYLQNSTESTKFVNRGRIGGDIYLDNKSDLIDNRKGSVAGEIIGGIGNDQILAGADGETFGGGQGHDRLVGGIGADTFVFASFNAADSDVIKNFSVGNDIIQFDHTVFTHLAVDQTLAFAISTKATATADFLFYNSGSGNLYYDVDGNRTARAPCLIANLGKGLDLTASNFTVV